MDQDDNKTGRQPMTGTTRGWMMMMTMMTGIRGRRPMNSKDNHKTMTRAQHQQEEDDDGDGDNKNSGRSEGGGR
jgi:hypothetical protein